MKHFLVAMLVVHGSVTIALADASMRRRAVEVFVLEDGTRLLGVSLGAQPASNPPKDHVRILLRAEWLKDHAPELYEVARLSAVEPDKADPLAELLSDHIERLENGPQPHLERIGYLKERLQGLLPDDAANDAQPDVVVLELPESLVKQKLTKKAALRQIAGLGILNGVEIVESRQARDVEAELRQLDQSSMIKDLPSYKRADADIEAALQRILVNADRLLGKTCHLIRHRDRYISESAANANPMGLATEMLSGQVQNQLQELLSANSLQALNKPKPDLAAPPILPSTASDIADREKADVVELTAMQISSASGRATVAVAVYYRMPPQRNWQQVVSVTATANRGDITQQQQQRILQDDRIRQAATLFQSLGIADSQLADAVSIGAVVEVAQQRAKKLLTDKLTAPDHAAAAGLTVLTARIDRLPEPKVE